MALIKSDFDTAAMGQAEEMYSHAKLDPNQRKLLEGMAKIIVQYVPVNELAIRGFCLMAAATWQKRYSRTVASLAEGSPQERLGAAKELAAELTLKLKQVLHSRGTVKEKLIDDAMKRVMEVYSQLVTKK